MKLLCFFFSSLSSVLFYCNLISLLSHIISCAYFGCKLWSNCNVRSRAGIVRAGPAEGLVCEGWVCLWSLPRNESCHIHRCCLVMSSPGRLVISQLYPDMINYVREGKFHMRQSYHMAKDMKLKTILADMLHLEPCCFGWPKLKPLLIVLLWGGPWVASTTGMWPAVLLCASEYGPGLCRSGSWLPDSAASPLEPLVLLILNELLSFPPFIFWIDFSRSSKKKLIPSFTFQS